MHKWLNASAERVEDHRVQGTKYEVVTQQDRP